MPPRPATKSRAVPVARDHALTSGAGTFTRQYIRHEPMPAHLADAVRKEHSAKS